MFPLKTASPSLFDAVLTLSSSRFGRDKGTIATECMAELRNEGRPGS